MEHNEVCCDARHAIIRAMIGVRGDNVATTPMILS
jgi:hypothetical protein